MVTKKQLVAIIKNKPGISYRELIRMVYVLNSLPPPTGLIFLNDVIDMLRELIDECVIYQPYTNCYSLVTLAIHWDLYKTRLMEIQLLDEYAKVSDYIADLNK